MPKTRFYIHLDLTECIIVKTLVIVPFCQMFEIVIIIKQLEDSYYHKKSKPS